MRHMLPLLIREQNLQTHIRHQHPESKLKLKQISPGSVAELTFGGFFTPSSCASSCVVTIFSTCT
jgi:hypothetical protein